MKIDHKERSRIKSTQAAATAALVGRTIVKVELNHWDNGRGTCNTDPVITLDNGVRIRFWTEESESGQYGTRLGISPPTGSPP